MLSFNKPEPEIDIFFVNKQQARKLSKKHGGNVRNASYRLAGKTQIKKRTDHYAVRIRPRSYAHKIEIVTQARELGSVNDPWK